MTGQSSACWPNGHGGWASFDLPPPTPCAPRPGVVASWQEGVELHGGAFVVLHGRICDDPDVLRRYAAAVLAAAGELRKGRVDG